MNKKQITSPEQLDLLINVTGRGPMIVLAFLLIAVTAVLVFVSVGHLDRGVSVYVYRGGETDAEYHDRMFETVMPEESYLRKGIHNGARVQFEDGAEGSVANVTTVERYEDLYNDVHACTAEKLSVMNVSPDQEPYCVITIIAREDSPDQSVTFLPCKIITESILLSDILY